MKDCQVILNGQISRLPVDKAEKMILSAGTSFSGSLEYPNKSALIFRLVNREKMLYIFNEIKKIDQEVKLDIRTNDEIAKGI